MRSQPYIFVVDDEDLIASTLAQILKQNGFRARSFTLPLEALDAAGCEAPDLLITDVAMPLLSGVELAIQVRQLCPDCRILLFSGNAASAHLLEAAEADGHDFELLTKPVHPAVLVKTICNLMAPIAAPVTREECPART